MRYHKPDYTFLISLGALLVFGLLSLFSASSSEGYIKFNDSYFFIKRQLVFGVLPGLILFYFCAKINYRFWFKWARPLFYFSILLLILILIPTLGGGADGARSWLLIKGFSFQPAELLKLAIILYLAVWLAEAKKEEFSWRKRFTPFAIVLALVSFLFLKQPDLGTLLIVILTAVSLYFLAGGRWAHLGVLAGAGAVGFLFLVFSGFYKRLLGRLTIFLNPAIDPQGIGYHLKQAYLAIGSGGFWGLGWGHSRQKFQYLPEARADSIFAVMAEELGFLISSIFILFLGFIFWRGLKIASRAPDGFGRLVVAGIMVWLVSQSFVNIASMIGLLPLTGLPLPLVSHGGSALTIELAALGIVVNISRQTRQV